LTIIGVERDCFRHRSNYPIFYLKLQELHIKFKVINY
jgi:hypothetical protein